MNKEIYKDLKGCVNTIFVDLFGDQEAAVRLGGQVFCNR